MNTDDIIKQFYKSLIDVLPMNDTKFRASLVTAGLLPGNLKDAVTSKPTRADMAELFLDNGIKNNRESLLKLLKVMQDDEYHDQLRVLAKNIQSCFETS